MYILFLARLLTEGRRASVVAGVDWCPLEQLVALQKVSDSLGGVAVIFDNLACRSCFNLSYSQNALVRSCFTDLRRVNPKIGQGKLGKGLFLCSHNALHRRVNSLKRAAGNGDDRWKGAFNGLVTCQRDALDNGFRTFNTNLASEGQLWQT